MGKNHSKAQLEQSELPSQIKILTPIQRWNQSQHTLEDVALLLQISWREWTPILTNYLKTINNKEKYQLYTTTILEHLRQQPSQSIPENQNKELFYYYSTRLAHSFFVVGQFHQNLINLNLKSKQKLLFLYEYYSLNQQQFERALVCNYPSILIEFPSFVSDLILSQIIIKNMTHFKRFILSYEKGELIKGQWEIAAKFYPPNQRQKILQNIRTVADLKQLYLRGIEQFMKYDNADAACQLICELQFKGYKLTKQDLQFYIKISLFGLFIYSLGKISLNYSQFGRNSIQDIIHLFYNSQNIQDTPQLIKCLQVATEGNQTNKYLLQYCLSPQSHISVMVRLLDHNYISFKKTGDQYQKLKEKVKKSRTQVGKYTRFLLNLISQWQIPQHQIKSLSKLLTLSSIMNIFGLNLLVQQLLPFVQQDTNRLDDAYRLQESAVKIIKMMISGFFSHSEIQNKSIEILDETYSFVSLYDLLHFLKFMAEYIGKNTLKQITIHQILFKQLIKQQLYQEINVLLREQNLKTYNISFQTVQLLIIEHLIELITTKKIRKIETSISILFSAIRLQIKKDTNHYAAAYYKYFKYLEDKDINLPQDIKQTINLKHLFYIADRYPNKLQNIDFNYLFTQQSCIRQHYSQTHTIYVPAITEQFLKFKIYLCSKCFNLKKIKLGYELIDQILICEPPWLSTQLIKMLKEPAVQNQVDENFINIAFKHCRKAEDLQYIIKLKDQVLQAKKATSSRLSIKNIKKLSDELIRQEKFIYLDNDIIVNHEEYINLIAEITFGKDESIRTDHILFFKLLAIEPLRAFNYALNYNMPLAFIINFIMEGIKRSVIHLTNPLPLLVRYFYFKLIQQQNTYQYIKYKQYCNTKLQDIVSVNTERWSMIPSTNSYLLATFKKMVNNYQFSKLVTADFVSMYIVDSLLFKFYYDEGERKHLILELRQQPMTRNSVHIFKKLCNKLGIDIVELSVYELISRVNSNDQIDDQAWEVIQKLIFWGQQRKLAFSIVIRLSQKIENLGLLIKIYDYIREREAQFKDIITQEHLSILISLAAIERDKNLFGIIPQTYFERPIGVYHNKNRGYLSQNHRKILQKASKTNIFVLSKALYLMYGCDQEIEKVVLGEFSLRQPDSEQFQLLRKKIKLDSS